ncbi:MAG: hypothetical protein ACE14T_12240 [Syntrophales bacterium]
MENEIIESCTDVVATPITDDTLISLAEQAERRIDAMTKIKKVSLKLTNSHDWTDQGGKPYLQVSGAEKIARMFGISWKISEPTLEYQEGGHFAFTYKGYFSLAGASIEVIGTRSSKDGFFKKYSWETGDDGKREKTELPPSEIDRGDVKKAAYTNCIGNGITRILGLRNMTYDDLREFAGITPEMVNKVDFKKEGKKQDGNIASEGAEKITAAVSDVRKKEGKSKAGKPYTVFIVKAGEKEFSTFSETFAKLAKEAKETGRKAEITYKSGQYGNDLENITFADDGPGGEREPGAEG